MTSDVKRITEEVVDQEVKLLPCPKINESGDLDEVLNLSIDSGLFDILVIHQGIIDKWWEGYKHDRSKITRLLMNLQKSIPRVVITTGRGRPDNIPSFVKVVPFPTLEASLFCNHPEKMILVGALMNILPIGNQRRWYDKRDVSSGICIDDVNYEK